MRFQALVDAASGLAHTILPAGTPSVPAVPASFPTSDTISARKRLEGAVLHSSASGAYFTVPPIESSLTGASKKLLLSADGNAESAAEKTEAALTALNIDTVCLNLFRSEAGGSADQLAMGVLRVGGRADGLEVKLSPLVNNAGLTHMRAVVAGGAANDVPINDAVTLVGREWLPWGGRPEQPPPIPAGPGIPLAAAAAVAAIDAATILGGGNSSVMRLASLNVMGVTLNTADDLAAFISGLTDAPSQRRPLSVALAAIAAPPAAADGAILAAARAAAPGLIDALRVTIDGAGPHHDAVVDATANLTGLGIASGPAEIGRMLGRAITVAEAIAPAPAPPPPGPPPTPPAGGVDPVAAAVAAALGTAAPDPTRTEAARRLAADVAAASLTPAQHASAVDAIAAALRSSGFTPPAATARGAPPARAPALIPPFAHLRIHGAEAMSNTRVITEIANAFGQQPSALLAMLATAAGMPPPDPFFAADVEGAADEAAELWLEVEPHLHAASKAAPPTSWLEAGRRLRAAVAAATLAAVAPGTSNPAGHRTASSTAADHEGCTQLKQSSGGKGRSVAASAHIINVLTTQPIIDAERAADKLSDPLDEASRIRKTAYGPQFVTFALSDGTVFNPMTNKGKPPPCSCCATPGRALPPAPELPRAPYLPYLPFYIALCHGSPPTRAIPRSPPHAYSYALTLTPHSPTPPSRRRGRAFVPSPSAGASIPTHAIHPRASIDPSHPSIALASPRHPSSHPSIHRIPRLRLCRLVLRGRAQQPRAMGARRDRVHRRRQARRDGARRDRRARPVRHDPPLLL